VIDSITNDDLVLLHATSSVYREEEVVAELQDALLDGEL
jgi:hypothetical protein